MLGLKTSLKSAGILFGVFCIKHVHIFTDNDLGWYFHLATALVAPVLAFYETAPKSLFLASTCVPGFEYAP